MVGFLVKVAVKLVMKDHFYSLNIVIRKQSNGRAIGNSLTEKIGKRVGKISNKKFKQGIYGGLYSTKVVTRFEPFSIEA